MLNIRKGQPLESGTIFVLGDPSVGFAPGDRVKISTAENRVLIERIENPVYGARGLRLYPMRRSPALRVRVSAQIPGEVIGYTVLGPGRVELELQEEEVH